MCACECDGGICNGVCGRAYAKRHISRVVHRVEHRVDSNGKYYLNGLLLPCTTRFLRLLQPGFTDCPFLFTFFGNEYWSMSSSSFALSFKLSHGKSDRRQFRSVVRHWRRKGVHRYRKPGVHRYRKPFQMDAVLCK